MNQEATQAVAAELVIKTAAAIYARHVSAVGHLRGPIREERAKKMARDAFRLAEWFLEVAGEPRTPR